MFKKLLLILCFLFISADMFALSPASMAGSKRMTRKEIFKDYSKDFYGKINNTMIKEKILEAVIALIVSDKNFEKELSVFRKKIAKLKFCKATCWNIKHLIYACINKIENNQKVVSKEKVKRALNKKNIMPITKILDTLLQFLFHENKMINPSIRLKIVYRLYKLYINFPENLKLSDKTLKMIEEVLKKIANNPKIKEQHKKATNIFLNKINKINKINKKQAIKEKNAKDFEKLPNEIYSIIFSFLPVSSGQIIWKSNKKFYEIINSNIYWKSKYEQLVNAIKDDEIKKQVGEIDVEWGLHKGKYILVLKTVKKNIRKRIDKISITVKDFDIKSYKAIKKDFFSLLCLDIFSYQEELSIMKLFLNGMDIFQNNISANSRGMSFSLVKLSEYEKTKTSKIEKIICELFNELCILIIKDKLKIKLNEKDGKKYYDIKLSNVVLFWLINHINFVDDNSRKNLENLLDKKFLSRECVLLLKIITHTHSANSIIDKIFKKKICVLEELVKNKNVNYEYCVKLADKIINIIEENKKQNKSISFSLIESMSFFPAKILYREMQWHKQKRSNNPFSLEADHFYSYQEWVINKINKWMVANMKYDYKDRDYLKYLIILARLQIKEFEKGSADYIKAEKDYKQIEKMFNNIIKQKELFFDQLNLNMLKSKENERFLKPIKEVISQIEKKQLSYLKNKFKIDWLSNTYSIENNIGFKDASELFFESILNLFQDIFKNKKQLQQWKEKINYRSCKESSFMNILKKIIYNEKYFNDNYQRDHDSFYGEKEYNNDIKEKNRIKLELKNIIKSMISA